MKTTALILILGLFITYSPFSRAQETTNRDPGNFTTLNVTGKIRVELYPGDKETLVIETDGTGTDNVLTENSSGKLNISLQNGTSKEASIKVKLYFTHLNEIGVYWQGEVLGADTIKEEAINFEARNGGKIELRLKLGSLNADISQAGLVSFYGIVGSQQVEVTSGGTYSAYDLVARESFVKSTTAGKAKIYTTDILEANAATKGFIGYKGNPEKVSIKTSLGGEVVEYDE